MSIGRLPYRLARTHASLYAKALEHDVNDRLLRALASEPLERPPIWFMRQAGRYLPEYRELRSRVSFADLCREPDLAVEATLQPLDRFDLDAAIAFSDILPVLEALGYTVVYESGRGPFLPAPLTDVAEIDRIPRIDVATALPALPETIRRFRRARPETPILGFAGAPFTLFCYLVEGGASREFVKSKQLLWKHPNESQRLLDRIADVVGDYLQLQVEAGAAAVQIFDTWAGLLPAADFRAHAAPAAARALARVRGAPRIYFTRDAAPFLPWLRNTGADAIGLDWRIDLGNARRVLGPVPVQGNLDPVLLFAPPEVIRQRVGEILAAAGPSGHVFNLGHGVLPDTPIEGVMAMVQAVRAFRHPLGEASATPAP